MGFSSENLIPLIDEGLGNSAYLVGLGDGRALAVDTSRDLHAVADRRGLRAFDRNGMGDGDELDLSGLVLRAWATPGHTDEHVSLLLLYGNMQLGVWPTHGAGSFCSAPPGTERVSTIGEQKRATR